MERSPRISFRGVEPLRNRRNVDTDMKVRITRVGQMTSLGMSHYLGRPRIRVAGRVITGNYVLPEYKLHMHYQNSGPRPCLTRGRKGCFKSILLFFIL